MYFIIEYTQIKLYKGKSLFVMQIYQKFENVS